MEEKKHKTGFGAQMMYGMAEFFNGGAFVIIGSFFTVFLIKAMGMPPALAGTVPLIGHVWDAITDPMMGNITDRTSAKMGPKRLYMLIWGPVMAKTSKRTTILIGAPIRIVSTLLLIPFSNEGASIIPILILACGIGIGNAATLTSIFAIMADMPDVDELVTGVHRPGVVSGMSTFARKISSGLSSWLIGVLLAAVGYSEKIANAGGRQALSTQHGIALIFILMPVILCVCLFIFGYRLPMTEKEFNVIKKEIARRRGEDNSVTTDEEKQICEKVTGLSYDRLWDPKNEWIGRRMSIRVVK